MKQIILIIGMCILLYSCTSSGTYSNHICEAPFTNRISCDTAKVCLNQGINDAAVELYYEQNCEDIKELTINETMLNQTIEHINYSHLVAGNLTLYGNATYLSMRTPTIGIDCSNISNISLEIKTKEGIWEVIEHKELCDRILQDNH